MSTLIRNAAVEVGETPIISNGVAYTSGDVLGTVQEIEAVLVSGGTASLVDITVIDVDGQKAPVDIFFFGSEPASVPADNVAFTLSASELKKCTGVVTVLASDYVDAGSDAVASIAALNKVFKADAGEMVIYAVPVIRDAKTYSSTTSVKFVYKFYQD